MKRKKIKNKKNQDNYTILDIYVDTSNFAKTLTLKSQF